MEFEMNIDVRVTHAAMGSATVLCAVLALVGYTTFRLCTRGNVLNNLARNSSPEVPCLHKTKHR